MPTAVTDDWSLYVKQKSLLGTSRQDYIEPRFLSAYTDLRSLLQLAVDLEAQHAQHHSLDKSPPLFLTVAFSGIVDRPAEGASLAFTNVTEPIAHTNLVTTHEDLNAIVGASGKTYQMFDARTQHERTARSPSSYRGRGRGGGRGGFQSRGRSPTRRESGMQPTWSQQSSYYEAVALTQ